MAGNIDSLNFKLILDDEDFNKRLEADKKAAKKFNTDLSSILEAERQLDKARAASNTESAKALRDAEKLRTLQQKTATEAEKTALAHQKVRTEAAKTSKELARAAAAQKMATDATLKNSRLYTELGTLAGAYLGIRGIGAFLRNLAQVTGEFETQRIALHTMLRDAAGADELIAKIRDLALVSPYTFGDLTEYAKQLSAYGIPLTELYDTTKRLADVSAGLGVDMSRIILAYGQIRSATVLRGQELRQLTEAGVPILEELARTLSEVEGRAVSVGDVFDRVGKRAISFEMVRDVFTDLTSEGGKFYKMQEALSESLTGRISNLKDAFEDMLRTMGEDNADVLKGAVDTARRLVEHYQLIGKAVVGLVVAFGSYKAALMAVAAWQRLQGLSESIRLIGMMRKELGLLTATQQAFNIASKANIYVAIASAVLGLVAALATFNKKQKEAIQASGEAAKNYETERKRLEALIDTAKKETTSKEDRRKAIEKINNEYGQYLDGMLTEKSTVDDLTGAYKKLTQSIRDKYLEEQRQAMTGEQQTAHGKNEAALWGMIQKAVGASGLDAKKRGEIMGRLQTRIGKYSGAWNAMDIYNEVVNTISNAGGKKVTERMRGNLYSAAYQFKESQADLRRAEAQFGAFSVGFRNAIRGAASGAASVADQVVYKAATIAEGIEALEKKIGALEKKAKGPGITEAERKTLETLRGDVKKQKEEYETVTGKKYDKGTAAAIRREAGLESAERSFYEGIRRDIEKYENEITAAQIDAMDEGTEKTLARLDLDHKKREQAIVANYNSELEKLRAAAEKEGRVFDPENDERAKALFNATSKALEAEAMTAAAASANVEKKANEQREQNRLEYLSKYGDLEKRRAAITEKYERQIQKARAEGDAFLEKSLAKQREAEIYDLEKEFSGLYALIFADVEDLSRGQLAKAIELTQTEISKAAESGDIQKLTELYARLNAQLETQSSRGDHWGFSGIVEGFRQMRASADLYENSTASGDKEGIAKAIALQQSAAALMKKSAGEISDSFKNLGATLEKFEGALGQIGGFLAGVASNTDNIVEAFTSKDKGSIVSSGVSSAVQLLGIVADQIRENKKAQEEWNETVKQCAHEYALLAIKENEYQESNFFGVDDPYKKSISGMMRYSAALEMLREKEDELAAGQVQTGTKKGVSWKNVGAGAAAGAGLGAAIGTAVGGWAAGLGTIIGTAIGAVAGGVTGLLGGLKEVPVYENILSKYGDILDRSDKAHPFKLNPQILADYDKLDAATKRIVDNWTEIEKVAEDALSEVHENITALVSDLGDTLREQLVNAWTDGQIFRAVDEFHDYIGGVIQDITEQLIFARFLKPAFDKLSEDMDSSFLPGGDQDIRDDLMTFSETLPDYLEDFSKAMSAAKDALAKSGFNLWKGESAAGSVGNGIQSITEDTANLLASYINGIRADVAGLRTMNEAGWQSVAGIREFIPTLNDHLMKISANTQATAAQTERTAAACEELLARLESVVGYSSEGTAIRVEID